MPRSPDAQSPAGALKSAWQKAIGVKQIFQLLCIVFVGKQVLDSDKTVGCREREALEKGNFRVHHTQVGGKEWHVVFLILFRRPCRHGMRCGGREYEVAFPRRHWSCGRGAVLPETDYFFPKKSSSISIRILYAFKLVSASTSLQCTA